mmetsp:Transcript_23259/g.48287  ORF Transcript_23259/g.48287 Transcript_23259/m.48287 type:complete len:208 (+) Transcript_23259:176-799(+)
MAVDKPEVVLDRTGLHGLALLLDDGVPLTGGDESRVSRDVVGVPGRSVKHVVVATPHSSLVHVLPLVGMLHSDHHGRLHSRGSQDLLRHLLTSDEPLRRADDVLLCVAPNRIRDDAVLGDELVEGEPSRRVGVEGLHELRDDPIGGYCLGGLAKHVVDFLEAELAVGIGKFVEGGLVVTHFHSEEGLGLVDEVAEGGVVHRLAIEFL